VARLIQEFNRLYSLNTVYFPFKFFLILVLLSVVLKIIVFLINFSINLTKVLRIF